MVSDTLVSCMFFLDSEGQLRLHVYFFMIFGLQETRLHVNISNFYQEFNGHVFGHMSHVWNPRFSDL